MTTDNERNDFDTPNVDEDYLMNVISGDKAAAPGKVNDKTPEPVSKEGKPKEKARTPVSKKLDYEKVFLTNRYPAGRNGKVVYIRPEFHERLLRLVQLVKEEKTTLYAYIDNILDYHFKEFGTDVIEFFNDKNKPIL